MLEHFIQFLQVWPSFLVEPAVADGGHDEHAVIAEHTLVPDHLGGKGLHHLDGIGAHAVAVMEIGGHAEHHDIVFLFGPVHVGAFVGGFPGNGLHFLGPAGIDFDLPGFGVQHGVAAEEFLAHLFFHQHALPVEFIPHEAGSGHRHEIGPVHHLGHVVGGDAPPMADAGGAVLVPAGIAAVGVALGVADQDGKISVVYVFVHQHVVALVRIAQVDHVVGVLAVVAGDLVAEIEFAEQFLPQHGFHFRHGGPGMQAVGKEQQDILFLNARSV